MNMQNPVRIFIHTKNVHYNLYYWSKIFWKTAFFLNAYQSTKKK